MNTRCPETDTVQVDGEDLVLQCDIWSQNEDGTHEGDHHVRLPPAFGGDRTWSTPNPA